MAKQAAESLLPSSSGERLNTDQWKSLANRLKQVDASHFSAGEANRILGLIRAELVDEAHRLRKRVGQLSGVSSQLRGIGLGSEPGSQIESLLGQLNQETRRLDEHFDHLQSLLDRFNPASIARQASDVDSPQDSE